MENFEKQTATVSLSAGEGLYDLSMITDMDDNEYLVEVLMIFLRETPVLMKEMKAAVNARKNDVVSAKAHKIKGSAGILQAGKLTGILEEIEIIAKMSGMNHELASLVESAGKQYSIIEASLKKYLKEIS